MADKRIDISPVGLVRLEWVGVYKPVLGMNSPPGTNAGQGALCVYENGTVLYTTGSWETPWESNLASVRDARRVTVPWPYHPSGRTLRANFGSFDRTICFSGSRPGVQLNLVEKAAGHLPTHATFGLGKVYVAARVGWMQRGSKERAQEACTAWLGLLTGQTSLEAFHDSFANPASPWNEFPYGVAT